MDNNQCRRRAHCRYDEDIVRRGLNESNVETVTAAFLNVVQFERGSNTDGCLSILEQIVAIF